MRKVLVIPVVVGVLGCVTKDLGKWIDRLGIKVSTAEDNTARHWILTRVLDMTTLGSEPRVPALGHLL